MDPLLLFFILISILLYIPLLMERIKAPAILGLVLIGYFFGPVGLGLLQKNAVIDLLAEVGMIFIMFIAGLEMDPTQYKRLKHKSLEFGFFTSLVPFLGGFFIVYLWGYNLTTAVLVGALFISHTLIAYPVVSKLGLTKNEPVAVVVGATIFNDIAALIVAILCVDISLNRFSSGHLLKFSSILVLYISAILYLFPKIGRLFFKYGKKPENAEFYFVLSTLFLATIAAKFVGIHPLVGAFLSGLAISVIIEEDELLNKIRFFGEVLFIPVFYIFIGMEMDLKVLLTDISSIKLMIVFVAVFFLAQYIGTFIPGKKFKYSPLEILHMWGLSIPQVAATLAILILGRQVGLIDKLIFNSIIMLSVVTAIISPLVVSFTAKILIKNGRFTVTRPQPPLSDFEFLVLNAAIDEFSITKGHPNICIDDFVILDVIEGLLDRGLLQKSNGNTYLATELGKKILDKAEEAKVKLRAHA